MIEKLSKKGQPIPELFRSVEMGRPVGWFVGETNISKGPTACLLFCGETDSVELIERQLSDRIAEHPSAAPCYVLKWGVISGISGLRKDKQKHIGRPAFSQSDWEALIFPIWDT